MEDNYKVALLKMFNSGISSLHSTGCSLCTSRQGLRQYTGVVMFNRSDTIAAADVSLILL